MSLASQTREAVRAAAKRFLRGSLWDLRQYPPKPLAFRGQSARLGPPSPAPTISIVTPSLNSATFIEATIRSVLDQDYPALEYICQDGASSDGTASIIARYADRLHAWRSEPDSGQTNALNKGFAQTTGEILAYLNSNDILLPGALAFVARFFRRHPSVDVIYSHRIIIDEAGDEVGRWILPPHDDLVLRYMDYIPQETMFWRRAIFEKAGAFFDEDFSFAMDWDLILRMQGAGARFRRVRRPLGAFRLHAAQKTLDEIGTVGAAEVRRLRERTFGSLPEDRQIALAVRPYMIRHALMNHAHARGLLRV